MMISIHDNLQLGSSTCYPHQWSQMFNASIPETLQELRYTKMIVYYQILLASASSTRILLPLTGVLGNIRHVYKYIGNGLTAWKAPALLYTAYIAHWQIVPTNGNPFM